MVINTKKAILLTLGLGIVKGSVTSVRPKDLIELGISKESSNRLSGLIKKGFTEEALTYWVRYLDTSIYGMYMDKVVKQNKKEKQSNR